MNVLPILKQFRPNINKYVIKYLKIWLARLQKIMINNKLSKISELSVLEIHICYQKKGRIVNENYRFEFQFLKRGMYQHLRDFFCFSRFRIHLIVNIISKNSTFLLRTYIYPF